MHLISEFNFYEEYKDERLLSTSGISFYTNKVIKIEASKDQRCRIMDTDDQYLSALKFNKRLYNICIKNKKKNVIMRLASLRCQSENILI